MKGFTIASSRAGDGYAAHIYTSNTDGRLLVVLCIGHGPVICFGAINKQVPASTWADASELVERFCRCWQMWRWVQSRARALDGLPPNVGIVC